MTYVDPADDILKWEENDVIVSLASKMNMHLDSVGVITRDLKRKGTYQVADVPARTALVNSIGAANISVSNPLFVWRANAATGRKLEYTINGSAWENFPSSETSYSTSPTLTAGTNWSITDVTAEIDNRDILLRFTASYAGTINVGATGNIANQLVATLPDSIASSIAQIPVDCQLATVDSAWVARMTTTKTITIIGGGVPSQNQTNPTFHICARYKLDKVTS